MQARLRSAAFGCVLVGILVGVWGCPRDTSNQPDAREHDRGGRDDRKSDSDLRVDPTRCTGDNLDLAALVRAGSCTIPTAEAGPLPSSELIEIDAPTNLRVIPGGRLEFDLILRNVSDRELPIDLRFRHFLPIAPEGTVRVDAGPGPDESCTLRAMSTEPPPERLNLPAHAELAIPCEWYANTRLVDPQSYVGSECSDFPALVPGRYRSVFRINGGAGTQREVAVEIEVR